MDLQYSTVVNLQVLIIFLLLKNDAQFKYHNNGHAEGDGNNQLDDLPGSLSEGLHVHNMLYSITCGKIIGERERANLHSGSNGALIQHM